MGLVRFCLIAAFVAGALSGCTPGAATPPNSSQAMANGVLVGVSLIKYGSVSSAYGTVGGYNPTIVIVAHGTPVQFHNEDNFLNTVTSIGTPTFPPATPFNGSALSMSGTDVAQANWSSGSMTGGAFSQALNTAALGTYLFGCYYHYPVMRGVIIVQ